MSQLNSSGISFTHCVDSNAVGWPQLLVTVYGLDEFGRDVIRGYGSLRLPTTVGK